MWVYQKHRAQMLEMSQNAIDNLLFKSYNKIIEIIYLFLLPGTEANNK